MWRECKLSDIFCCKIINFPADLTYTNINLWTSVNVVWSMSNWSLGGGIQSGLSSFCFAQRTFWHFSSSLYTVYLIISFGFFAGSLCMHSLFSRWHTGHMWSARWFCAAHKHILLFPKIYAKGFLLTKKKKRQQI